MEEEGPSFFELLGRDPDLDGAVLASRRKSLDEVDGEYVDVAESDFMRLEALEARPAKKHFLPPKLALPGATAAPSPAPAAAAASVAAAPVAPAIGDSFQEATDSTELSLAELLQEDFERQRAETARAAASAAEASKVEAAAQRVSLTARLRGRSASISVHQSDLVQPVPVKTRGSRSRTISEVVSDILRPHSREQEASPPTVERTATPPVSRVSSDASAAAGAAAARGVETADDGEPMAFADFLEQDQASSLPPATVPERGSSSKKQTILTRARNASVGGGAWRRSPLGAGARSPTEAVANNPLGRMGSSTMLKLSAGSMSPEQVARLVKDLDVALAMYDYAKDALCEENVEAMMLIHEFRLAPTDYLRRRAADEIVARFLAKDAPRPINIDARSREAAKSDMANLKDGKAVPTTLFDGVMNQLSLLTHTDMMQRFIASTQCLQLKEGMLLRAKLELPEVPAMEEQVRNMCSLRHWHQAPSAEDGLELWDADEMAAGKGGVLAAGACRGAVRVSARAEAVMRALMEPGRYAEWLQPMLLKSAVERSFGSFFQVAELQAALDAQERRILRVGALRVCSSLSDCCVLLVSVPPERGSSLKAPKVLEIAQAGFIITAEEEMACRVVMTLAFKPAKKVGVGLAKTMVTQVLGKLRERKYAEEPKALMMPEELAL